uniref:Pentatricopeptide repeat-containing protein At1g12300, mitochondrial-like n=1 Tax=Cicer arietinum TaxID=3827 RepID=A0A3Q7X881_CICAR|nr:pentatricopeptide repeat-containing protein At1g12300, mitochondrial-like [Cicer arietinum]
MTISRFRYVAAVFVFIPKFTPFQFPKHYFSTLNPQFDNVNHLDAASLFNRLLHKNPTPPPIEFGKILGSIVKAKHYSIAISLSQQMEIRGIHPDFVTCSLLMNCFCQLGHITFAFSVFSKILKRGYRPNTITLNTLVKGFCLKGEVHKALHFHDKLEKQEQL